MTPTAVITRVFCLRGIVLLIGTLPACVTLDATELSAGDRELLETHAIVRSDTNVGTDNPDRNRIEVVSRYQISSSWPLNRDGIKTSIFPFSTIYLPPGKHTVRYAVGPAEFRFFGEFQIDAKAGDFYLVQGRTPRQGFLRTAQPGQGGKFRVTVVRQRDGRVIYDENVQAKHRPMPFIVPPALLD